MPPKVVSRVHPWHGMHLMLCREEEGIFSLFSCLRFAQSQHLSQCIHVLDHKLVPEVFNYYP